MHKKERKELANWVVDYTLKSGANEVDISLSNARRIEIEYRDKKLEKLQEATQNSLSLILYIQGRYSVQTTNDLRKKSLKKFIEESVTSTKYLDRDEYRSLPDPKYYPENMTTDLHIYDSGYGNIKPEDRLKIAAAIEEIAMLQDDKIISVTSGYYDSHGEVIKIHSNGFSGESQTTSFSAGAEVTVKEEQGGRPEDWFYAQLRFFNELPSPEYLGKQAVLRALRKIGQKKISSGQYNMIVENRAGRRLISILQNPMCARYLQQKSSFLEGMLGKNIASEKLTLIDDPFLEKGLSSRHFDGEGLAAKKRIMIDKGILTNYYIDHYYGKKLGMEPTSGSTSNLIFEYAEKSQEDLIKEMGNGILVTYFIGGNANTTTGDFSLGIVGLLIENSEIIKPLNEMNISGNAKEFWHRLVAMGNNPYPYSSWQVPSMFFEKVQFSGI
jgi:PmbA protein